jgi:hypothetical protein
MTKPTDKNSLIFAGLIGLYILAQVFIGTYDSDSGRFFFDKPADGDFLYYAAIINTVTDHFPPENPAFAGVKLTQSFLQYYPAAFLAKLINPYNAIRVLNVAYLILLGLVLKKYSARTYGLALLLIFAASAFAASINASGVDLIARGFTHTPFFILFALALLAEDIRIRGLSIAAAAFVNGYLMLLVIPYLLIIALIQRKRNDIILLVCAGLATISAAWLVSSEAVAKPFYFIFTESFAFKPIEIILHAIPIIIMSIVYYHRQMRLLIAVTIIFGSFIHYNPFFPVFMLYFAGAMTVAAGRFIEHIAYIKIIRNAILVILIAGFVYSAFDKYNPKHGIYFPRYDSRQLDALEWVKQNTSEDDVFLALTADTKDMAYIMEYRPVYMGYIGHVAHLGLDWQSRYNATMEAWAGKALPEEVDYIYYGPVEKKYFPDFVAHIPQVYRDSFALIYRAP